MLTLYVAFIYFNAIYFISMWSLFCFLFFVIFFLYILVYMCNWHCVRIFEFIISSYIFRCSALFYFILFIFYILSCHVHILFGKCDFRGQSMCAFFIRKKKEKKKKKKRDSCYMWIMSLFYFILLITQCEVLFILFYFLVNVTLGPSQCVGLFLSKGKKRKETPVKGEFCRMIFFYSWIWNPSLKRLLSMCAFFLHFLKSFLFMCTLDSIIPLFPFLHIIPHFSFFTLFYSLALYFYFYFNYSVTLGASQCALFFIKKRKETLVFF